MIEIINKLTTMCAFWAKTSPMNPLPPIRCLSLFWEEGAGGAEGGKAVFAILMYFVQSTLDPSIS